MLVAKDMDKTVNGLEDLCAPSNFQLVVNIAKRLTQFSPGKNEYGKPSAAVKIEFGLKGAVKDMIGQGLMNYDNLAKKKWFEPLPKCDCSEKLYLRMVEDEARGDLMHQMSLRAYKALNETVLVLLIISNEQREEEASHLTLEIYKKASTSAINEDIYETLSLLEKELSKIFTHVEIRGE